MLFVVLSCDPSKGPVNPPGGASFKLNGIFVRDVNLANQDVASFQLLRNSAAYKLATVSVDTFRLDTVSTGYFKESPGLVLRPGQSHGVGIIDSASNLNFSTALTMPDTFSFTINSPAFNIYRSSDNFVQIEWTGSAGATGYFVACVNDSAGKDTSFFPGTFTTNASIPRQAFRNSGDQVVEGLYKIYVVAFKDGFYAYPGMPFPTLSNYSPVDTIYSSAVSGRVASAFVARYDTIRATTLP